MVINPAPSVENFGGKGYQLYLLKKTFNVPDFFVVSISDSRDIENNDLNFRTSQQSK